VRHEIDQSDTTLTVPHSHEARTDNPGIDAERDAPLAIFHRRHPTVAADLAELVCVPRTGYRIPGDHRTTGNRPAHPQPGVANADLRSDPLILLVRPLGSGQYQIRPERG
jgi:hypothetical protein